MPTKEVVGGVHCGGIRRCQVEERRVQLGQKESNKGLRGRTGEAGDAVGCNGARGRRGLKGRKGERESHGHLGFASVGDAGPRVSNNAAKFSKGRDFPEGELGGLV
jgi:hypothetical protein